MANSFFDLISQLQKATGNEPRETAMPGTFIGRPIEELEAPMPEEMDLAAEVPVVEEQVQQEIQPQVNLAAEDIAPAPIQQGQPFSNTVDLAQNQPSLPVQSEPEVNPLEKLLGEYRSTRQQNADGIKEGYEADRKAQLIQGLASAAANVVGAGFAGGNVMAAPKDLRFNPIDLGYAKQAKDTGSAKLEGLMADIQLMKAMKGTAPDAFKTVGGSLLKYNPETKSYDEVFKGSKEDALNAYQQAMIGLRQQELSQRNRMFDDSESRRVEQMNLGKMERPIKQFNSDKVVQKSQDRLASAEAAQYVLQSGNPIGDEAVKTFLARASGEVGTLTDQDAARFGGSKALTSRLKAVAEQYNTGMLTDENRNYLMQLTETFKKSAQNAVEKRADNLANQQSRTVGIDKKVLKSAMLGYDIPESENSKTNSNEVERIDPKTKKIAIFDVKTKKFLRYK